MPSVDPVASIDTRNRVSFAHLLALAGYFGATLLFTWPLAGSLATAIPGDSFDGWQNYWNQWWIKLALVDRLTWPLHTDILYAPTGVNLYFHTLNPFNGLATLPIQLAGGLIPAYNAVVFMSWVLAGYGMFLLARWVIGPMSRGPTNASVRLRSPGHSSRRWRLFWPGLSIHSRLFTWRTCSAICR